MKIRILIPFLALLFGFYACGDDSDDNDNPSSSNNNSGSTDITGTYTGEEIITYTEKSSNTVVLIDTSSESYTIKANGSSYQLEYLENGTTSHLLNISVNGNSFSGSGTVNEPWYEGETYSGTISGNRLSMNYSGEDEDQGIVYTYSSRFTGDRPPKNPGGGGSGGSDQNSLTIPGSIVGSVQGFVDCNSQELLVNFDSDSADNWWAVTVSFPNTLDMINQGTYQVVDDINRGSLASNECSISIYYDRFNIGVNDAKTLVSSGGGVATVTIVDGRRKVSMSNIPMSNPNGGSGNSISLITHCSE